jgi:heme exporter protein B
MNPHAEQPPPPLAGGGWGEGRRPKDWHGPLPPTPSRKGRGSPLVPVILVAVVARELRLSLRHGADTLAALLFFLLTASLFPLAIGPAPETLGRIAPGIIWVCSLLAALLPLDRLFGGDFEDGSLDQLLLCGLPPAAIAMAKAAAHWLVTGLPLLLAAAPLAVMLRMPAPGIPPLLIGLLPGTMLLSLLGTTVAAVVLGARRGGVLLPLLVLPLATPVLIFGVGAADAASGGLSARPHLLLLTALLAAGLPLCPLAAGAALRAAAE